MHTHPVMCLNINMATNWHSSNLSPDLPPSLPTLLPPTHSPGWCHPGAAAHQPRPPARHRRPHGGHPHGCGAPLHPHLLRVCAAAAGGPGVCRVAAARGGGPGQTVDRDQLDGRQRVPAAQVWVVGGWGWVGWAWGGGGCEWVGGGVWGQLPGVSGYACMVHCAHVGGCGR